MRLWPLVVVVLIGLHFSGLIPAAAPSKSRKPVSALTNQTSLTVESLAARLRPSVVIVRQLGRDGSVDGVGAGFVVRADGIIATCLHVIGESRRATVEMADGRTFDMAGLIAWDRKADLAIFRVNATDLKPLPLGSTETLAQGASVVAMGNPQGLTHSIVEGVVSAFREVDGMRLIQLAIPIEPGNSGGPLVDRQGRVQGVLSMKSVITDNLGFAIPVGLIQLMLDHPNAVPLDRWLALGTLDPKLWTTSMGARWLKRGGRLEVDSPGTGFGGRSLCLSSQELPAAEYEVSVQVRLDDEAGAAGLAFAADGKDTHYGFYPTAGQMRLTRFEGPDISSWQILAQTNTSSYLTGQWNHLTVRLTPEKMICSVNGTKVFEMEDAKLRGGRVGLVKFRQTQAAFSRFTLRPAKEGSPEVAQETSVSRTLLAQAKELENQAMLLRRQASDLHVLRVQARLESLLSQTNSAGGLFQAALELARLDNEELDPSTYLEELKSMSEEARSQITASSGEEARLGGLISYFFQQAGFHGSRSDYQNRANSYINEVMDFHEGLPITLSVLFLELGRQLGIHNLHGAPLPGRFMVGFTPPNGPARWIDVYDGGKILNRDEVFQLIDRESEVQAENRHFQPASDREIIVRMLRNLAGNSGKEPSGDRVLRYLDCILAIEPERGGERWRRAFVRFSRRDMAGAKADLQWLLDKKPEGVDLQRVEEFMRSF